MMLNKDNNIHFCPKRKPVLLPLILSLAIIQFPTSSIAAHLRTRTIKLSVMTGFEVPRNLEGLFIHLPVKSMRTATLTETRTSSKQERIRFTFETTDQTPGLLQREVDTKIHIIRTKIIKETTGRGHSRHNHQTAWDILGGKKLLFI